MVVGHGRAMAPGVDAGRRLGQAAGGVGGPGTTGAPISASSLAVAAATSATAASNAAEWRAPGARVAAIFLTNWRAASWTSPSVAGGAARPRRGRMLRHMAEG